MDFHGIQGQEVFTVLCSCYDYFALWILVDIPGGFQRGEVEEENYWEAVPKYIAFLNSENILKPKNSYSQRL